MASKTTPIENTRVLLIQWGANSYGQLGTGDQEDTVIPTAVGIPSPSPLKQVIGGGGHTVCVSEEGQVYVCGWNKNGQLGLGHSQPEVSILKPLSALRQKVTKVSCGWNHTLCITEDGRMWAWGCNLYQQLGIPFVKKQANSPVNITLDSFNGCKICDIGAGLRHSIALTENGWLYSWGDGKKGQLGQGKHYTSLVDAPQRIESLQSAKCSAVVAGAYHSATITDCGALIMWGLNQYGQCAVGNITESISPHQVSISETNHVLSIYEPLTVDGLPPLIEVHCGWSNTLAITLSRKVYTWGRSDYGQLGYKSGSPDSEPKIRSFIHVPREIPELRGIKQAACGSEHTIALSADNHVLTFGWNEHGMCGTGGEDNVYKPHTVQFADNGKSLPSLVGAGAGHSTVVLTME